MLRSSIIRWIRPRPSSLAAALTMLLLAGGACSGADSNRQVVECDRVEVDGRKYCVYDQPITETGYDCPQGMSHPVGMNGGTVCSGTEKVPEKHKEKLREEMERDTSEGMSSRPNVCAEDAWIREFVRDPQTGVDISAIPWRIVSSGGSTLPASFTGTWKGTETLDSPISFRCPPGTEDLNLDCTTDRALVIERETDQGATNRVKIAVSLPLGQASLPAEGTSVRVASLAAEDSDAMEFPEDGGLGIQNESTGAYILVVREPSDSVSEEDSPLDLSHTYGGLGVSIDVDESADEFADPSTAYCVVRDGCPRTWRFEHLAVEGESKQEVAPGSQTNLASTDGTYQFYHLGSATRPRADIRGWPDEGCADLNPPQASYAFVRTGN